MSDSASATGPREGALGALSLHTVIYLIGNVGSKLASILLLPLFTRDEYLSPADYGVLAVLGPTILLCLQLLGFQLDAAMSRHYFETEDPQRRRLVVSTTWIAVLMLTALVTIPMACLSGWLAVHWLKRPDLEHMMLAVAVFIAGMVLCEVSFAALRVERRSVAASGWSLLRTTTDLVLKIVCVVGLSMGVMGVMTGQAISAALFLVGFGVWTLKRHGHGFDPKLLRSMAAFSAPMVVAGLCQFALHNADRFMLPIGSPDLGRYDVGYQFGYAVNSVVLGAFLLIWYPFIFGLKSREEQSAVMAKASLHIPALIVLLSLPIALLAPEIIDVLTANPEFDGAWVFIPVILVSYVFWGLFQIGQTPFYIHKQTRRLPLVVGSAAAINIGANLLLIPPLGAMGAALATLLAMAALALLTRLAARRVEIIAIDRRVVHLLVISLAAGAALYLVPQDAFATWFALRVAVLIAGAGWLLGPFLTRDERAQIVALVHTRLRR